MFWCVIYGPKRLLLLSELFYMLWCVIYGPKRLLLLSELFYMLWCVIYGPPCIFQIRGADYGHTTHARTAHLTTLNTCRPESVGKQHYQARLYIGGPQTLIKRSPKVVARNGDLKKKKDITALTATRLASRNFWKSSAITSQPFSRNFRTPTSETNHSHCGTKSLPWPAGHMFDTPVIGNQTVMF